jgi:hypothetical protein
VGLSSQPLFAASNGWQTKEGFVPRLSIIIPVLGSAARLETTLVSVLENRPSDCEIIVVHNAPYDDPYNLAGEVRFVQTPPKAGLAESVNEAIEASIGGIVHLLAAGLEVTDGWTERILEHFADPRVASVAPLIVDMLDRQSRLAAGLEYSARRGRVVRTKMPPGDSTTGILGPLGLAAFYRRSALELVGGLSPVVGDSVADVDLALSLRAAGYRGVLEHRSTVFAARHDIACSHAGFKTGLAAERLFWRAAPIAGWGKSILAHPVGVIGEFVRGLPTVGAFTALLGRIVGACQMRSHRAHHHWLVDVERAASALFRGTRPKTLRVDPAHETIRHSDTEPVRAAA